MIAHLLQASLRQATSLLAVSALAFCVVAQMPADPVEIAMRAWNLPPDPDTIARLRMEWGLDRPLVLRWLSWLGGFVTGDWGLSFRTGAPVRDEFLSRLPLSLGLGAAALALAVILAIPLGFAAALRPNGWADRFGRGLVVVVQAVPSFWLGLVLIWLLAAELRLIRPFSGGPVILAMAAVLIALPPMAMMARVLRRELLASTTQPWFRTAIAKGLSQSAALRRHSARAGAYALLAALRSEIGWMLGTTATLEVLFGLPGVSQFVLQSVPARDYGVLLAYVMTVACLMALANLVITLILQLLDPRAR
ncbi:ABC transporter permease [Paracoccus aminophilus]|uniref:ABC-type dipeptide/oligopeptide/nickel transport systems, permease component n=1 Tax=Paracoccus aminophilus JCM 7686 TaxID=1367847 RepID=S5XZB0_PARAH|nr:ABC transporter permease [Paracoccus aminophilus]AGT10622.1 ABC-type dipeptide/oligopeptide/nickel transport systems, permease component [Paracoccus aminophilus JCM 7686]